MLQTSVLADTDLHAVDDVWEKHRDVFAHSHGRNDFLDCVLLFGLVHTVQVIFEFKDLSCIKQKMVLLSSAGLKG